MMNWTKAWILPAVLCVGCFSDPERAPVETCDEQCAADDMSQGADDGVETPDMGADAATSDAGADACTPITACAPDQCGEIDDGCGGVVQCGAECGCVDGVPSADRCGTCGLGRLTCADGETGEGTCVEPPVTNLSTLAGSCDESVVYVSSSGTANGAGTVDDPVSSTAGLVLQAGSVIVLHAPDGAPLAETVELTSGVHLVGGYGDTFVFDPDARSFIRPPAVAEDQFGVRAQALTDETMLYGVDVQAADAPDGYSSYGLHVYQSTGLLVRDSKIVGGHGGDGTAGTPGADGADGQPGGDGGPGVNSTINSRGAGGNPGINASCGSADGGRGGAGEGVAFMSGQGIVDNEPSRGNNSEDGNVAGGDPPSGGSRSGSPGDDASFPTTQARPGDGGTSAGTVENGLWVYDGDGENGQAGVRGSGGGGGGGARKGVVSGTFETPGGPGGGGGGAGGCGGGAGGAGTGGGASFGLFAVQSDVTTLESSFASSMGGAGGSGAAGGAGGAGAVGGQGSNQASDADGNLLSFNHSGGAGGDGADGRDGAPGGGGAGGVSYGAYCEDATVTSTDTTFTAGTPGSGGSSPGNPGGVGGGAEMSASCTP